MHDEKKSIVETFAATCRRLSTKKAIAFPHKDTYGWISYNSLYLKAIALSEKLKALGITPHSHAALLLDNTCEWPATFFALILCRAVIIPLNPQEREDRLTKIMEHARVSWLLTSSEIYNTTNTGKKQNPNIYFIDTGKYLKAGTQPQKDISQSLSKDVAVILYTSGTTGTPKGVILTHKNLLANVSSLQAINLLRETDCILAPLPFHHSYPLMVTLLLPLLSGASISIPPALSDEAIIECMQKTGVTIMVGVPRMFELLTNGIEEKIKSRPPTERAFITPLIKISSFIRRITGINPAPHLLPSLHKKFPSEFRFMISGGAKLKVRVAKNLFQWGFTVLEGYGLTEAAPVVSFNLPREFKFGSAGRPLPGVEIKIAAAPQQEEGEILVKGENVSYGYYRNSRDTSSTFKDGWLHTNDTGYIDKDGFLFITGRKNEMIVLPSGKNINPEEIESVYQKSPFIKEICIILPEGSSSLVALIYPDYEYFSSRKIVQIKERIRWELEKLSRQLPPYQRIKDYRLINSPLPRTVLGKLRRQEANKIYENMDSTPPDRKELTEEDKLLLSHPLCRKGYEFLTQKLNRHINLDDHLELDLGLDSLEQIGLLLEFKNIAGTSLDEFQLIGISTVRDIMEKLKDMSSPALCEEPDDWHRILKSPPPEELAAIIDTEPSLFHKIIFGLIWLTVKITAKIFFHLSTRGKTNIPRHGPFIITPNHASFLDAPLLAASLPLHTLLNTFFLGYRTYIEHPLLSWSRRILRLIPIDPASTLLESLAACAYALRKGKNLCLFPEGARSIDGEVKHFQRGVGILMKEVNAPVLPVYLRGTHRAWPPYRILPRPAEIQVIFGKPLHPDRIISKAKENIDIYQHLVDNVREVVVSLQRLKPHT